MNIGSCLFSALICLGLVLLAMVFIIFGERIIKFIRSPRNMKILLIIAVAMIAIGYYPIHNLHVIPCGKDPKVKALEAHLPVVAAIIKKADCGCDDAVSLAKK